MPQSVAISHWPLPLQAHTAFHTPHSPCLSESESPNQLLPLTRSCLHEKQMPEGDLHAEAGPNPKLNTSSCANKEVKGKFLCAASGVADYISTIKLMYPASVEYLTRQ